MLASSRLAFILPLINPNTKLATRQASSFRSAQNEHSVVPILAKLALRTRESRTWDSLVTEDCPYNQAGLRKNDVIKLSVIHLLACVLKNVHVLTSMQKINIVIDVSLSYSTKAPFISAKESLKLKLARKKKNCRPTSYFHK